MSVIKAIQDAYNNGYDLQIRPHPTSEELIVFRVTQEKEEGTAIADGHIKPTDLGIESRMINNIESGIKAIQYKLKEVGA